MNKKKHVRTRDAELDNNVSGGSAKVKALQNAFDIINTFTGESIKDTELWSILQKMGVNMKDKEFQATLKRAGVTKDRMVNVNNFMAALGKERQASEYVVVKDAIHAIDKIEGDKMLVHDLPYFMRDLGIHMSDQEFQQALKQVTVDGNGKVVLKDFVSVLTDTPHFKELQVLKKTINAVNNIQGNKVPLQDLSLTLKNMGIRLNPQEYEELIQAVSTDREGKVDIEQVVQSLSKTQRFQEMEVLNNSINVLTQFREEKVKVAEIEGCFKNVGIHLTKSELKQITTSLPVSSDGNVDIKDLSTAMKKVRRFGNYSAVLDTVQALKFIKEQKRVESKPNTLGHLGLCMANDVISQVMKSTHMTETGQAQFNDFLRKMTRNQEIPQSAALTDGFDILSKLQNGRIGVQDLQLFMNSFNINLPPNEVSQALAFCPIDNKKTINLKDFLKGLTHTTAFVTNPELQLTCLALSKLKGDHFDLHVLESSLNAMDLPEAAELLQGVMKTAQVDSNGKVNFREFMRVFNVLPEFPQTGALKQTFDAMSKMKDHRIHVNVLSNTLENMGIHLTPEELQALSNSVEIASDGTLNFEEVINSLTGTKSFTDFRVLQHAFDSLNLICRDKIKKEELPAVLEDLGIRLSGDEIQAALACASIDDDGKLDGAEFLKILVNAPRFSEFTALHDAMKIVENTQNKKMTVMQLEEALDSMGVHLPNAVFSDIIKSVKTDETGKIDFREFLLALGDTEDFTELEALQRAIMLISTMYGEQLTLKELQSTLDNLGIYLKPEEFQELANSLHMSEDGTVNLKDCLTALTNISRIKESMALHSATETFSKIRSEKVDIEDVGNIVKCLGVTLSSTEIQQALKTTAVDEHGKVNFKELLINLMGNECYSGPAAIHGAYNILSKVDNEKVAVSDLADVLAALGITLTSEEIEEILERMTVDSDGMVNLKDFMRRLPHARKLAQAIEMEDAIKMIKSIKQDRMRIEDLDAVMRAMGLNLSQAEIQEVLKTLKISDDGTVSLKDFMFSLNKNRRFSLSTKNKVPIENLGNILKSMGIDLTEEEMHEVLKHVTIEDGKVHVSDFMNQIHIVRKVSQLEVDHGETVALDDVASALSNLGIHLTPEQLKEALKHVTVDENGKVNMTEVMKSVLSTRTQSQAEMDRIDVRNLDAVLESMGIYLTDEELQEALKYAPVDKDGRINLNEFMNGVRNVQLIAGAEGEKIEISELSSTLAKMGIHLTEEEMQEALKHITLDADGKVNLKNLLENILPKQQPSEAQPITNPFATEMNRIDVHNLDGVLANMGIHLTEDELQEALKYASVDKDGKINLNEFMNGVRNVKLIADAEGKMIEISELSSTLAKMGIRLTGEEMQEALKHITLDADGKVNLKSVLEHILPNQQPDLNRVDVHNLDGVLASMGIHLTEDELQEALKYASVDKDGKINLSELMNGVRNVKLIADAEGKKIEISELSSTLAKMGINLTEEEMKEVLRHITVDADGKVNLKNVLENILPKPEREKVNVQDLASTLASKGIHLSDQELQEVLKNLKVNADGTINLSECIKVLREMHGLPPDADDKVGLEELRNTRESKKFPRVIIDGWTKEKKVDIDSLDTVLEEMGIHLTSKQLYEALKYAPIDADGMVDLEAFKRGVKAILASQQTAKGVDVNQLNSILAGMGLHLTKKEMQEALKQTMRNKDGTINLKDFMWAIQNLPGIQEGNVDVSNLDSILGTMGIFLTLEELEDALKLTKFNVDGTVNLKDFIRVCNAILAFTSPEVGTYPSSGLDARMLKLPHVTEKHHHHASNRIFFSDVASEMAKSKAARSLTKLQLEAFREAYNTFSKDLDGKIDLPALEATARNLGISLTEEEAFDELVFADTDGDGKVNFIDFLNIITDNKRFIQAVAPKKGDADTVDARGILFFELLSKLVETAVLPRKATKNIVSYYRQKFLESTGKKAWLSDSDEKRRSKKEGLKKSKSISASTRTGVTRICIMKDKELQAYVDDLRAQTAPSDSPYAQVPIFPLIPNRDGMIKGKPKVDIHKLEEQRRMEPISSFEDHFFQKKRWMNQELKNCKTSRPVLCLPPELKEKRQRLTFANLQEIRREVKKVTDCYRKGVALRERNNSLRLWRRLRGREIGVETGNPSFYQTFSTYTWSWNVRQELLTPRELQEYDRQHPGAGQASVPSDKPSRAVGSQRGSKK